MADISIVKIKVRRGTNSDRNRVILDEGELGFTTDTQRLFVGDGGTLGGVNIANKFLGYGDRTLFGETLIGDLVYDTVENSLFALTGFPPSLSGNWINTGVKPDNTSIALTSAYRFGVIPGSIDRRYINTADLVFLGLSATPNGQLTLNIDNNTIKFNPSQQIFTDTSVIPLSTLKSTGLGLDGAGLKIDNLPVLIGLSAITSGNPTFAALPSRSLFIVNEPSPSNIYYVMIKSP